MMGIRDKLLLVIGDCSINQWARDRELPPQTVHGWIDKDRVPRKGGMETLVKTTGIPEDWWLHGSGSPPSPYKSYPVSSTTHLVTGSEKQAGSVVQDHSGNDIRVNNFVTFPKYALQTMPDQVMHSDQVVDYLAFKKDWLEESLSIYDSSLALIKIRDDNMEPTLAKNDLILTELSEGEIDGDSIYVLKFGDTLTLRRIQRKMDGSLLVFSDNKKYRDEEYNGDKAKNLPVVGKVVLHVRRV